MHVFVYMCMYIFMYMHVCIGMICTHERTYTHIYTCGSHIGRATRVAAGGAFTLILMSERLLSLGANNFGQLGRDTVDGFDATPLVVDLPPLGGCDEGGGGGQGAEAAEGGGVSVREMSCGHEHAIVALSDGSVFVWGRGTQGALGLGAQMKSVSQPQALQASGEVRWALTQGSHAHLLLAAGGGSTALLAASTVVGGQRGPAAAHAAETAAAAAAAAAAADEGENGDGQAAAAAAAAAEWTDGRVPTLCLSAGREAVLYTWGMNKHAELGHGSLIKQPVAKRVKSVAGSQASVRDGATWINMHAVSMGPEHSVALAEWRLLGGSALTIESAWVARRPQHGDDVEPEAGKGKEPSGPKKNIKIKTKYSNYRGSGGGESGPKTLKTSKLKKDELDDEERQRLLEKSAFSHRTMRLSERTHSDAVGGALAQPAAEGVAGGSVGSSKAGKGKGGKGKGRGRGDGEGGGQVCCVCGEEAEAVVECGMCLCRVYCSRSCQQADWKAGHKKVCAQLADDRERGGARPEDKGGVKAAEGGEGGGGGSKKKGGNKRN